MYPGASHVWLTWRRRRRNPRRMARSTGQRRAQWYTLSRASRVMRGSGIWRDSQLGEGVTRMAQMLLICPLCKRENAPGVRFCKYCGRLLVDPGVESPQAEHAPLYESRESLAVRWESEPSESGESIERSASGDSSELSELHEPAPDATSARIVIRVYPTDFDASDSSVAQHVGEFALEGRTVTIGRGQSCDIVFDKDNLTSRQHAVLRPVRGVYVVADLGSSNGTFINGLEIHDPTPLTHGDRILIGQHELIFLLDRPRSLGAQARPPVTQAAAPMDEMESLKGVDEPDERVSQPPSDHRARPTGIPVSSTAKHASVARLSSELAASASRLVAPQRESIDLDAIRSRLMEASEALTRQAGAQAALAERRRAALAEARDRLAALIDDLRGVEGAAPDQPAPPDLIDVVARVAEDPNNLEHLRALASHAREVADALRAQGPSEGQWSAERARTLSALEELRARLQDDN